MSETGEKIIECRVRSCVRPDHLEAVTNTVNVSRGNGASVLNAKKTACVSGHPFDDTNTALRRGPRGRSYRRCRACERAVEGRRDRSSRVR